MTYPHVDTDVLIRFLTGDDPVKQAESAALFQKIERGELTVAAPDTVIADAVYVLASHRLYGLPRAQVRAILSQLVRLPHFRVQNRRQVLRALNIYGSTNLDFGDAFIVAAMELSGSSLLYSYDADFDRIPTVDRVTPPSP
jgi:predicted nucleic acid-binding protein